MQLLLGHVHLDYVAPYLEVSKKARREAMANLGGFFLRCLIVIPVGDIRAEVILTVN